MYLEQSNSTNIVSVQGIPNWINSGAGKDTITGANTGDMLAGNGGKDTISAENVDGAVEIYGGAGNDTLTGGNGDDWIAGNSGNDKIYGGAGNDYLFGGDWTAEADPNGNDEIHGGAGDDHIYGRGGNDKLYGDEGNDTIYGGAGDDIIDGGEGADVIYTSEGNNRVILTTGEFDGDIINTDGSTSDIFEFSEGVTMAALESAVYTGDINTGNVTVTLANGSAFTIANYLANADENAAKITFKTTDGEKTIAQIDPAIDIGNAYTRDAYGRIFGTDNADYMVGDDIKEGLPLASTFYGKAGNDIIISGKGNDTIYGGTGNDKLIFGVDGNGAGDGKDTIINEANSGNDTIKFYNINSNNFGVKESGYSLVISYTAGGADTVTVQNCLTNNHSVKYIDAYDANGNLLVYSDNGTLIADPNPDYEHHTITIPDTPSTAQEPFITLNAKDYGTNINGGIYAENIFGSDADNVIRGGGGNDVINVTAGGNNTIYADSRAGDKVLVKGGAGNDTLTAGYGKDTFEVVQGHGADIVNANTIGKVVLDVRGIEGAISFGENGRNLIIKNIGEAGDETVTVNNYLNESFTNNVLIAYDDDTAINPVTLKDYISNMQAANENSLIVGNSALATAQNVNGTFLDEKLVGGSGNDTLNGGKGIDILNGGSGDDNLYGYLNGTNYNDAANAKTYVFNFTDGGEHGIGSGKDKINNAKFADKIQIVCDDAAALATLQNNLLPGGVVNPNAFVKSGNDLIIKYALNDTDTITVVNYYSTGVGNTVNRLELTDNAGAPIVVNLGEYMFGSINNDTYNVSSPVTATLTISDPGGHDTYNVAASTGTVNISDNVSTAGAITNDIYRISGAGSVGDYATVTINDNSKGNDMYYISGDGYKKTVITDTDGIDYYSVTGNDSHAVTEITDSGAKNDSYIISGNNQDTTIKIADDGGYNNYNFSGSGTYNANMHLLSQSKVEINKAALNTAAHAGDNNDSYFFSGNYRDDDVTIVDKGGNNNYYVVGSGAADLISSGDFDIYSLGTGADNYMFSGSYRNDDINIADEGGNNSYTYTGSGAMNNFTNSKININGAGTGASVNAGNGDDRYLISGSYRDDDITIVDNGGKNTYSYNVSGYTTNLANADIDITSGTGDDTYTFNGNYRNDDITIVDNGGKNTYNYSVSGYTTNMADADIDITSGTGDDTYTFNGNYRNDDITIVDNGGKNTYNYNVSGYINNMANADIDITSGTDNDTYTFNGNYRHDNIEITDNGGADKYTINGTYRNGTATITDIGDGDDTYTIASILNGGKTVINDEGGNDTLIVSGLYQNTIALLHNWTTAGGEDPAGSDLYVFGKNCKGGVKVTSGNIETIKASGIDVSASIDALKEQVVGWLNSADNTYECNSVSDVFGNDNALTAMMTDIYAKDYTNMV